MHRICMAAAKFRTEPPFATTLPYVMYVRVMHIFPSSFSCDLRRIHIYIMYVISIFMMEWDRNHACLAFTAFTLLFMSYVVSMYQWMFRSYPSSHITPLKSILSPTLFIPCLLVRFIYIAFCSCSSHVSILSLVSF